MVVVTAKHRVYLAIQAIDFRMGIDALFALCKNHLALDPFSGHYFIFRNRKATAIKILAYDTTGFWLCHKRLSQGRFRHWPTVATSVLILSPTQLQVLLQQGDPDKVDGGLPWRLIEDD
jgi:transposase